MKKIVESLFELQKLQLKTIEDLVEALRTGGYRPLDFRLQKPRTPITPEVLSHGSGL